MAVCKLLYFIIQHTQVFCLGVLIAAAVALPAINDTEESTNQCDHGEFEDASDYREAAKASFATSSIAIAYHVFMIILCCIYLFYKNKSFLAYMHSW